MANQLSPTGYNPYGQNQVLDELQQLNPDEYQRFLNSQHDLITDYRDKHWFRKFPTLAGVPGRSW